MEYKASKKQILDIVRLELRLLRINPLRKEKSGQVINSKSFVAKSSTSMGMLANYLRPGGVVRFQTETVELANSGLEMVFGGNWPNELGSFLYVYLIDLWISARRNYFGSLRKGDFQ